ncbi:hypothetical protein GWI34_42150, partial [Actinomadura sp. DSM 109109]|nr:hypothetical protein [Actinomadura lepetitiana]
MSASPIVDHSRRLFVGPRPLTSELNQRAQEGEKFKLDAIGARFPLPARRLGNDFLGGFALDVLGVTALAFGAAAIVLLPVFWSTG